MFVAHYAQYYPYAHVDFVARAGRSNQMLTHGPPIPLRFDHDALRHIHIPLLPRSITLTNMIPRFAFRAFSSACLPSDLCRSSG
jgi:hypothetical protein